MRVGRATLSLVLFAWVGAPAAGQVVALPPPPAFLLLYFPPGAQEAPLLPCGQPLPVPGHCCSRFSETSSCELWASCQTRQRTFLKGCASSTLFLLLLVSAWDHGGTRVFSRGPQPSPTVASETVFTYSPHVHSPHEDRFLSCGWLGRALCRHCLAVIRTQSSLRVGSTREDWALDIIRENSARAAVEDGVLLGHLSERYPHAPFGEQGR